MRACLQEYCGDECPPGTPPGEQFRLVRRDPALADNSRLPELFERSVGARIWAGLRDGFRGQTVRRDPRGGMRMAALRGLGRAPGGQQPPLISYMG